MAQGQMIKGQTPSKLNKEVQVDENGYIILSPLSSITVTGGSGGGGNALTTYYYIQKDTTSDLVNYKYTVIWTLPITGLLNASTAPPTWLSL